METPDPETGKKMRLTHILISAYLFIVSFLAYLKTICPTVYMGDSGEIIVGVLNLGIVHPPGYPLFCLLSKPFTWLPWGSMAFRVNLSSAFFASSSAVFIYLFLFHALKRSFRP